MIPQRFIDYYGDQFRWFIGKVVDLNDPLTLGRVKINAYGIHDEISSDDLPWASVVTPMTQGGNDGLGNILGIQINAQVFGIFLDGQHSQLPLVLGSIPKDGDTNPLTTGTQTKSYTPNSIILEPSDPYAAQYPYNHVYETESGHVKEYDDTPNAERIRELHKSGTFYQIGPDGDLVTHIVRDRYTAIVGNDAIHISGEVDITVDGVTNIVCPTTNIEGNVNISGNLDVDGSVTVSSTVTAEGEVTGNSIALSSHSHTGIESGGDTSGGPV